jgi:hypothetical protein
MGHFGKQPIRVAWFSLVLPALLLNYFGQGALLLRNPPAAEQPFFLLAPEWALLPLVALATAAAIIASQALISGAFSLTQQAIQLGYCPRLDIDHTSHDEIGQVYVPQINWALMISTILIVIGFGSSTALAAASASRDAHGDHCGAVRHRHRTVVARQWPRGDRRLFDIDWRSSAPMPSRSPRGMARWSWRVSFTLMTWKTGRQLNAARSRRGRCRSTPFSGR